MIVGERKESSSCRSVPFWILYQHRKTQGQPCHDRLGRGYEMAKWRKYWRSKNVVSEPVFSNPLVLGRARVAYFGASMFILFILKWSTRKKSVVSATSMNTDRLDSRKLTQSMLSRTVTNIDSRSKDDGVKPWMFYDRDDTVKKSRSWDTSISKPNSIHRRYYTNHLHIAWRVSRNSIDPNNRTESGSAALHRSLQCRHLHTNSQEPIAEE